MLDLYKRIWRITGRAQVLLIVLSLVIAGLAAVPLKFQKEIINGLTGAMNGQTLLMLGAGYLGVLLLRNALKFALQYKSTIVGEGIVRLIRTRIYNEKPKGADRGTIAEMIASEAEEVGRFAGGAMASPLLQLGTLVSVVGYIAINQPFLALFMIAVVAPQAMIVAGVQQRINERIANRVKVLRRAISRITAEDL